MILVRRLCLPRFLSFLTPFHRSLADAVSAAAAAAAAVAAAAAAEPPLAMEVDYGASAASKRASANLLLYPGHC